MRAKRAMQQLHAVPLGYGFKEVNNTSEHVFLASVQINPIRSIVHSWQRINK